jgi:hypothetical protein
MRIVLLVKRGQSIQLIVAYACPLEHLGSARPTLLDIYTVTLSLDLDSQLHMKFNPEQSVGNEDINSVDSCSHVFSRVVVDDLVDTRISSRRSHARRADNQANTSVLVRPFGWL